MIAAIGRSGVSALNTLFLNEKSNDLLVLVRYKNMDMLERYYRENHRRLQSKNQTLLFTSIKNLLKCELFPSFWNVNFHYYKWK